MQASDRKFHLIMMWSHFLLLVTGVTKDYLAFAPWIFYPNLFSPLAGMEGGPVLDEQGALAGMLIRPLRQRGGSAEVQVSLIASCVYKS